MEKLSRKKTKTLTVTKLIQWSKNAPTILHKEYKLFAEGKPYMYYSPTKHLTQMSRTEPVVIRSSLSEK